MLTDYNLFLDKTTINDAVFVAKELFGENVPYTTEEQFEGTVIIFEDHFVQCVREALTTGCMAKMNSNEEELFIKFIAYQNGHSYRDIGASNLDVVGALDRWLTNLIECKPNVKLNGCYDAPRHTWDACGSEALTDKLKKELKK